MSCRMRFAYPTYRGGYCRYCYGLQVFSWSGFPDCRHARHSAVRRCFFHPFRDFYAATGLCRDASNGTPDFSTPYATCASLRIIA
ncbi:putative calcium-binding protein, regucalcin, partial [Escherichia coli MS 79-10]